MPPKRNVLFKASCFVTLILAAISATGGPHLAIENIDADSHYPTIRVSFTVYGLDDGSPQSLDEDQISIIENKIPIDQGITITRQPRAENYLCMVFSIDSSRSISKKSMSRIRKTARDMIKGMDKKNKIALFRFNDRVVQLNDFTRDHDEIINNINHINRHGHKTLLYDSIYDSILLFESIKEINKKIIVFTDGKDEGSVYNADEIILLARKAGIPVYFICFKGVKDMQKMARISRQTGGKVIVGASEDIAGMYGTILSMMKNRYIVEYVTSLKRDGRSHSLEIRLKRGELRDSDSAVFQMTEKVAAGILSITHILLGVALLLMMLLFALIMYIMNRDKRLMREHFESEKSLLREMIARIEVAHQELHSGVHADINPEDSECHYVRGIVLQKDGLHRGKKHKLKRIETIIGSGTDSNIQISDALVSSRHAKIVATAGSFYLFDLISDCGTHLNGKKLLRPKALHDWDEIKIGRTVLIFRGFTDPA